MIRNLVRCAALAGLVAGVGACDKEWLAVDNPNSPNTSKVLATPKDAEALLAGYYKRWHAGVYSGLGNVHGIANMMSFQNFSSLANNSQNARTPFTGFSNCNVPGCTGTGDQREPYFTEAEVNRVASSVLKQLDTPGFTLGSSAQDARARAFGEFLRGVSLGYIALFYDSATVITAQTGGVDEGKLFGYVEVMDSALAALQRAIDATNLVVTGQEGFPLPATWIPSPTTFSAAEFIKLVRSYRARFRANVGRTPTERANPPGGWAAIIADAQNGITANHMNTTSTTAGPVYTWAAQYDGGGLWHQMPAFYIGMADASGTNYNAWLAIPVDSRSTNFFMQTPDLRFPQGATRGAQQADFSDASCTSAGTVCKRYFVNRASGADQLVGAGWGWSNYNFVRFHPWRVSGDAGTGQNGNIVFFTKAEIDMIQAEGLLRTGNIAGAAALVNATRTANGLAAMSTADSVTAAADCVPRVPSGTTTSCGKLWEAMKYEKRIETAYTHFAAWFLDNRGWGDLAKDIPLYWATPYQDLLARGKPISKLYGTGPSTDPTNATGSAKATVSAYGW